MRELYKQEKKFTSLDFLKINICSWNLGGLVPLSETVNLNKWLFPFGLNQMPDMYVIGFQEIVSLKLKNLVSK